MTGTTALESKENTTAEAAVLKNDPSDGPASPWHTDLADLEAETNEILDRFGKSRSGSRSSRISSPANYHSVRPLTQASVLNRSFTAKDRSKKKYSRPSTSAIRKNARVEERTVISDDLRLFKADGSARNLLRDTISSALSSSKFESVPSLQLAVESSKNCLDDERPTSSFRSSKKPSVLKKASIVSVATDLSKPSSLSLRDVKYAGSEPSNNREDAAAADEDQEKEVCFNCWSAGEGKKCTIHMKAPSDSIGGQNLSMCSNWDTGFLRRKYRAEEIQEVFSRQSQTLVFDASQQQFCTHEEAKHPIYRLVHQHVARLNFLYQRRHNTKLWLKSFVSKLKEGSFQNNRSAQSAQILCLRGTCNNMDQVHKLTGELFDKLPKAPVTGTTMKEKLGQEQVLVERVINVDNVKTKCQFVLTGPAPVPQALYRPRRYEGTPPTKFVMQTTHEDTELVGLDFSALQQNANNFIEYTTFGRKGSSDNLAVGGLPAQMLVSKMFTKCFPPQYKDITCFNDAIILPPKAPQSSFQTLEVPPDHLPYVRRELVTPLDARHMPTVMTKVGIGYDERHYFGLNRVEQTGEEEDVGFRTSTFATIPEPNDRIDPTTFRPSESIATPNALAISPFRTMRVDESYPFRQENSRTNVVDDLYHLLLSNGDCSRNKLQVFTTVGSQQVGYFLQNGDPSLPIGRLVTKVVRTWPFLQEEPERGKDPYNDPPTDRIYREEKTELNLGGVLFNDRPRYGGSSDMGSLSTISRSDARNAILRKKPEEDESKAEEIFHGPHRQILPGLLDAIAETRVGKRIVEYLPYSLNLPTPVCIQRFKPMTSLENWAEKDDYNPWASGKEPLSTHFVWSLSQETKKWPKANHNKEDPKERNTDKEFAVLCSLVRHGKYRDLEDTLNNPEWSLPIDYCDESGNTLLMVACQNGNRRIVKLCLRRGSKINRQNLNGNSCLHFAFGYGFADLGDYLISKGADDSIQNVNGLTCYEGLDLPEY